MTNLRTLYEQDFNAWVAQHVELLKGGRFHELDLEHLVEELRDRGRSERRELVNRLRVLLAHLLKWERQLSALSQRWAEFEGKNWRNTILEQRSAIAYLLQKGPGLKSYMEPALDEAYPQARDLAAKESDLPLETFPPDNPYRVADTLDDRFFPAPR